uniref:Nuclear pore protein n=2 Tax=Timema TaxID=61471 RepID=A0A7R9HMC8_9NEOP|nr:unnamed protein product [Timema monikensis]
MSGSDFNELLQAAEQLSADVEGTGELPRVERTLREVLDASSELWTRVAQTGPQNIQAHLLLGSKGVDLPKLSQKLDTLSTRKTFEPLEPMSDVDIQSFLKNEQENALLSIIEETNKTCFEDVEKQQLEHMLHEWKQEQQRALNTLLGAPEDFNIGLEHQTSILGDSVGGVLKSLLDSQEMAYAKEIITYNRFIIQGTVRPSLVQKLSEVADLLNNKKVSDLWEMVRYMTQVPAQASGDPLLFRRSKALQTALISQAKKYLQDRYKSYMNNVVTGNLKEAQRGGVPGTYPLVRSFVNIRVPQGLAGLEDGMVDDQPVWALIYYCLRCGDIKAALHCVQRASPQVKEFSTILQDIEKSRDQKLNPQAEAFLQRQYRQQIKHMTDPYKRAVYSVISACDIDYDHPEVAKAADDYLWFKLWQIREEPLLPLGEPHSGEKLTYAHLQSLILEEYGRRRGNSLSYARCAWRQSHHPAPEKEQGESESHYNAQEKPLVYYQVLFLTGQFEAALEFLFRMDKFRVHAVHMAMAMHQQNLLALPTSFDASLLTEDSKYRGAARRLNYSRLIILYVRRFETTDIKEALNYYYFLREIKGPEDENLFTMCVADLAQETQQFAVLFGHLRQDGCRVPGLIDTFQGAQVDPLFVIEKAASVSEEKGLTEDAINLYDLSGMTDHKRTTPQRVGRCSVKRVISTILKRILFGELLKKWSVTSTQLQAVAREHGREVSASTIRRRFFEGGLKAGNEKQKLTPAMIKKSLDWSMSPKDWIYEDWGKNMEANGGDWRHVAEGGVRRDRQEWKLKEGTRDTWLREKLRQTDNSVQIRGMMRFSASDPKFFLYQNHQKVLSLLVMLLSQVVHHPPKPGSLRSRLQEYSQVLSERYSGQPLSCSMETHSTFLVLRDLLNFFDLYHLKDYQHALEVIQKSRLIPFSPDEIKERVENFRRLGDEICRVIPDILIATMNILYSQYNSLRGSDSRLTGNRILDDSSKDKQISFLRSKSHTITSFAGTVPYRMPGDTLTRLVQMDILMN